MWKGLLSKNYINAKCRTQNGCFANANCGHIYKKQTRQIGWYFYRPLWRVILFKNYFILCCYIYDFIVIIGYDGKEAVSCFVLI